MDIRLLSHLYVYPKRPTSLASKLQSHESHMLLNGIKHCFILAVSRVAFAPEPEWMDSASAHALGTVNEIAADLVELILSPEEMESTWEMLNDEDDEEGEQVESQTQMDDGEHEVIDLS